MLRGFVLRIGDVSYWWPCVDEILERHDLAYSGREPAAGIGGRFPAFLHGDVVVKLSGYIRSWRQGHKAERAMQAVLAIDRFLHAVASFVSRRGFTPAQGDAHAC